LKISSLLNRRASTPPLWISLLPIIVLLVFLTGIIVIAGADAISDFSTLSLLSAALLCIVLAAACGSLNRRGIKSGIIRSARQILPAVPMLICIAMVGTTWMLSGVVPVLIEYGLQILNPTFFLVVTCIVCSIISVLTGSSWSTIATIGVAFMGIGTLMGFSAGWIAGAVISGAYFGDKVSPLSDTTVIASSTCGVDLFDHIRYLMITSFPAMLIALLTFFFAGMNIDSISQTTENSILNQLEQSFVLTSWTLLIPAVTLVLIALRIPTLVTLLCSSMLGLAGIFIFQPGIVEMLSADGIIVMIFSLLWQGVAFNTGIATFDDLVSTSGITGMLPTVSLVLCAMTFGAAMIGTGMLARVTTTLTSRMHGRFSLVGGTVCSGLFLNSCTADQYLSIIIGGNMYRSAYKLFGLEQRLLSRTLEDSISVTSVIIPWNSCGVTQSAVLGVSTFVYFPYCVFNYLSPVMSLLIAFTGFKIKQSVSEAFKGTQASAA